MVTPEFRVKAKLKAWLFERKCYWVMPVMTGYGATTLDFLVCLDGKFIAYETKSPGRQLTARQRFVAEQIVKAGGEVYKVTLVNGGELHFEQVGNAPATS